MLNNHIYFGTNTHIFTLTEFLNALQDRHAHLLLRTSKVCHLNAHMDQYLVIRLRFGPGGGGGTRYIKKGRDARREF